MLAYLVEYVIVTLKFSFQTNITIIARWSRKTNNSKLSVFRSHLYSIVQNFELARNTYGIIRSLHIVQFFSKSCIVMHTYQVPQMKKGIYCFILFDYQINISIRRKMILVLITTVIVQKNVTKCLCCMQYLCA